MSTKGDAARVAAISNPGTTLATLGFNALTGGTKTKVMDANDLDGMSNITQVSADQWNNYNKAIDFLNQSGLYEDQYQKGIKDTSAIKKSSKLKGSKTRYYDHYGVWNDTGNSALDNYINSGLGDWDQYQQAQTTAFNNQYNLASDNYLRDYINQYLDPYRTNLDTSLNTANDKQFADAKSKLDAQLSRGYLSDTGYNKALADLEAQVSGNLGGLSNVYNSQLNSWNDDISQAWAKGANASSLANDPYAWLNADKYMQFDEAKRGVGSLGDHITNYGGGLMDSLLAANNSYNPDEYIATGANYQGVFNPEFDFNTKKKKNAENIGAF